MLKTTGLYKMLIIVDVDDKKSNKTRRNKKYNNFMHFIAMKKLNFLTSNARKAFHYL